LFDPGESATVGATPDYRFWMAHEHTFLAWIRTGRARTGGSNRHARESAARGMMHAMGRLYMLLFALEVLLVVLALISVLSAEDGDVRALPRFVWIILILLFPIVGSITYFAVGRPLTTAARPGWRIGGGFPEATRPPRAPDDDPAFLASLEQKSRREDQEMLRQWEADLRRREEELRQEKLREKKEDTTGSEA